MNISKISVPPIGPQRLQWIQAIEKNQEFDYSCSEFDVCNLHFRTEDFINKKGGIQFLRSDAVPSLFALGDSHNFCAKRPRLGNEAISTHCEGCIKLELSSIKKELEKFNANTKKEQSTWLHRLVVPVGHDFFCICGTSFIL